MTNWNLLRSREKGVAGFWRLADIDNLEILENGKRSSTHKEIIEGNG